MNSLAEQRLAVWSGMLRQESAGTREEERTPAPGTPCFPQHPSPPSLEPPQRCLEVPGFSCMAAAAGARGEEGEERQGHSCGQRLACRGVHLQTLAGLEGTSLGLETTRAKKRRSNQSQWLVGVALNHSTHPSPSDPHSVRGRNPAAIILSPEMQTKAQRDEECLRSHCEVAEPGFKPSSPAPEHTSLTIVPHCLSKAGATHSSGQTAPLQACIQAALCLELALYLLCMKLAPPPCLPVAVTSGSLP